MKLSMKEPTRQELIVWMKRRWSHLEPEMREFAYSSIEHAHKSTLLSIYNKTTKREAQNVQKA